MSRGFDNSFRVTSQSVNGGNTISFGSDNDDLLTSVTNALPQTMTLTRSSTTGLLLGTTLVNVSDTYDYDTPQGPKYGEVTSYAAAVIANPPPF